MYDSSPSDSLDEYYRSVTKNLPVEVRHFSLIEGKGVFAKESFQYGQTIFVETPLVSHRFVSSLENTKPVCVHCMHSFLEGNQLGKYKEYYSLVYPSDPKYEHCQYCKASFCSLKCKQVAWEQYHEALCVGSTLLTSHPMIQLETVSRFASKLFIIKKVKPNESFDHCQNLCNGSEEILSGWRERRSVSDLRTIHGQSRKLSL